MRKFIIKTAQHSRKSGDPFGFTEAKEHLYFYAAGFKDLRSTIRCATAPGYGVPSPRWFSKYMYGGYLEIKNPLLLTMMHEIMEIDFTPKIERIVEHENNGGFKHKLKIIDPELWTKTNSIIA